MPSIVVDLDIRPITLGWWNDEGERYEVEFAGDYIEIRRITKDGLLHNWDFTEKDAKWLSKVFSEFGKLVEVYKQNREKEAAEVDA